MGDDDNKPKPEEERHQEVMAVLDKILHELERFNGKQVQQSG